MALTAKSITKITSPQDIVNYLRPQLYGKHREHFMVILLDTKNQIIKSEVVSIGTLNASLVHPREVFNEAIRVCANSLILSHNHPSGIANPSPEDQQITKRLVEAGKILGISVLDHVIITDYNNNAVFNDETDRIFFLVDKKIYNSDKDSMDLKKFMKNISSKYNVHFFAFPASS